MDAQQQLFAIIARLVGQNNILTVPRIFIDLTGGDLHAALLLGQCVYWSDRGRDGVFYKSDADWRQELGLTDYRLRQAKDTLRALGFISTEVHRANGAPTTHYAVHQDAIVCAITRLIDGQPPDLSTVNKSDLSTVNESDSVNVNESITETTHRLPDSGAAEAAPGALPSSEPELEPSPETRKRRKREKDPLFEALCEVATGVAYQEATRGQIGYTRAILREITGRPALRAAPPTPEEIRTLRARYRAATGGLAFPEDPRKVAAWIERLRSPSPGAPDTDSRPLRYLLADGRQATMAEILAMEGAA